MVDFLGNISRAWTGKIENEAAPKVITSTTAKALVGHEFGHRVLDSALIVLKVARTLDARLQNNADIDDFYRCLDTVERIGITSKSFENKTVIVIEGLEGSGKSTLADQLSKMTNNSVVLSRNSVHCGRKVESVFHSMPGPVIAAFEYHHARCVENVCERVPTVEEVIALDASVFEWPFDLPVPQLVVFLAVSTEVRLQRLEADARPAKNAAAAAVMDTKENTVYSKICGPTTVGIDANSAIEDVCQVVFDACEYYGVPVTRVVPPETETSPQQQYHQQQVHSSRYSIMTSAPHGSNDASDQMSTSFYSTGSNEAVTNAGGYNNADVYANRRISMGVYGVFTKLVD